MKDTRQVEVKLCTLTSASDRGEWSSSCSYPLNPYTESLVSTRQGWMGTQSQSGCFTEEKNPILTENQIPPVQPIVSQFIE